MWFNVNDEKSLEEFVKKINYFHDSCIKEMKYFSGAYVEPNLYMHPINENRILNILIQRQYEDISMIEMEFSELEFLKLRPVNKNYTCEIFGATMFFKNNYIYWYDDYNISNLNEYDGTVVCASKFRWRIITDCLGNNEFFVSIK